MNHLQFLWYGLALLSGIAYLGSTWGNPRMSRVKGGQLFTTIYLLISGFILLATTSLYIQVNIPSIKFMNNIFISAIPLFIGALNLLIPRQISASSEQPLPRLLNLMLRAQIALAIALSLMPWLGPKQLLLPAMLISVASLFIVLTITWTIIGRRVPSRSNKRLSILMATQAFTLPLLEVFLWPIAVQNEGITISLPLVYIINNILLWKFSSTLFPSSHQAARNDASIFESLSSKEKEIALAVAKGLSNKEIAAELAVSPSTVKNHLYTIFKKLGITNRTSLVCAINEEKPN